MKLELSKPLAFFDLETTGTNVSSDRIVEIGIVKLMPNGDRLTYSKRVNPGITIPPESSAIHGIYDADVEQSPRFEDIVVEIETFIADADLAGYNSNKFDIPVLAEEMMRAGSDFNIADRRFIDVQNIFHKMEQRTLAAAYQFYCKKDIENAHNALADTEATFEVFLAQLERYAELKPEINFLADFSRAGNLNLLDFAGRLAVDEKGEAIYNFGKHKGKSIREVAKIEPGYYGWMMDADFPLYTKKCLKAEMDKIKSARAAAHMQKQEHFENKLEALKNKFNG
jgi:DNA polymerase III subunit epsilon